MPRQMEGMQYTNSLSNELADSFASDENSPTQGGFGQNFAPLQTHAPPIAGKETIWIFAESMSPAETNGCSFLETVELTAGQPNIRVLDFDKDADEHAQIAIAMPKRWDLGPLTYRVFWTNASSVTTGVAWALQAKATADGELIDAAYGTAVVVTDDSQSKVHGQYKTDESAELIVGGTLDEYAVIDFDIYRDVSDANDDLAEDARLRGIQIYWTAKTEDDS